MHLSMFILYHASMTEDIRLQIKMELLRRGMSQRELASELGMKPQYLAQMLSGRVSMVPARWQQILEALGLELCVRPKSGS